MPDRSRAGDTQKPSIPDQARYSDSFLRDSKRKARRATLFGALFLLAAVLVILKDTLDAYRNHSWVNLAARATEHALFPPIIGALLGLAGLGLSLYLLWAYFFRRL